ncbi:hypothetical protein P3T21_006859 [Paraburkholderia sp. GAS334]
MTRAGSVCARIELLNSEGATVTSLFYCAQATRGFLNGGHLGQFAMGFPRSGRVLRSGPMYESFNLERGRSLPCLQNNPH